MKNVRHIIWDFNGTLLDDVDLCVTTMNTLLIEYELPKLDVNRYKDIFQFPVKEYYRTLGFNFEADPFEKLAVEYLSIYNQEVTKCQLYQGVIEALTLNRTLGIKQYILSAFEHDELINVLHKLDIIDFFDDVAGLDNQHAASKTAQGHRLMQRHQLSTDGTVMIGDTHHDLEVANELNIDCLLIDHGHQSRRRLDALHPWVTTHFRDIPEQLSALKALNTVS
ncbi:HAD family hydrolase [Reinekea sp.]|jgi:phosphoglycolate phosphatase|uniref:HAD family hydrolase n=1 Tax=Reinekea sp. TaxID=1970455 RepID=UPI003988F03B